MSPCKVQIYEIKLLHAQKINQEKYASKIHVYVVIHDQCSRL